MTDSLRWALIGASDIAATRIIPAIKRRGDTIRWVQSGTQSWATEFASTHTIGNATTGVEEACGADDVDAVYISSKNESHVSQALTALQSNKHVLCEKPLALTLADGQRLVDTADRQGKVLATNHHLPAASTHQKLRDLVISGSLGKPLGVRVGHAVMLPERLQKWRLDDPSGGGVILDVTVHDISAVQAILDATATEATALGVRQGDWGDGVSSASSVPDAVMAVLTFGDVPVQLHDAFTVEHAPTSITVIGSEASVHAIDVMTQDPAGTLWRTVGNSTSEVVVDGRPDLYDVALDGFASAVRGEGPPIVSGRQGLTALAGALAVQESVQTGRKVQVAELS